MAEEIQSTATDTGTQTTDAPISDSGSSSTTVAEVAPSTEVEKASPVTEKMIPQSQVNKIAAREARSAAEKARQETVAEFQRQQASQQLAQPQAGTSIGGMSQPSQEQIEQTIMRVARQMSVQDMANRVESEFKQKIESETLEDPEFADLYESLNIEQHPDIVLWMNGFDNTAKIIKDLARNPAKFSNVLMLARSGATKLAQAELHKLSSSIKANEEALKNQPEVNAPLSQVKPSNIGADNGNMQVSDFRKQPWLRG